MRRRDCLAAVGSAAATAAAGCSALDGLGRGTEPRAGTPCELDRSRERGTAGWPSLRGDPRNTGAVPGDDAPVPPLELDWVARMSGLAGTVQPSVVGDTVHTSDYDDTLHALAADSGEPRWQHTIDDVYPGQAVVGDRVFYTSDAGLRAYDRRDGTLRWTAPQPDGPAGYTFHPTSDGEVVAVGTDLGVAAVDVASGERRWHHRTGLETHTAPAVVDGVVVAGSDDTYVRALDAATGERRWRAKTDGRVRCPPAVVDGRVFVGSNDGTLYALDAATGEREWTHEVGPEVRTLAVTGGHVFAVGRDRGVGPLVALRADTGERCWRRDVHEGWGGLAVGLDHLWTYVPDGDDGDTVGAVDPATGEMVWRLGNTGRELGAAGGRLGGGLAVAGGALHAGAVVDGGVAAARLVESRIG
jgi:outer membrane protein assembly factor BamB